MAVNLSRGAMIGELGGGEGGSGSRSGAYSRGAGGSRGKSSRRVARKQSGGRLVTEGARSGGLFDRYYTKVMVKNREMS